MRTATITIDRQALAHNLQQIKNQLKPKTKLLAMIKSDAYGHGVANVLPALMQADGFGVAFMDEAMTVLATLNKLKTQKPIVILQGVFSESEWQQAIKHDFGCVIHHQSQVDWALTHKPASDSFSRTIWLKHNSGMNRLGFDDEAVIKVAQTLNQAGYQIVLTTHFACADQKDHPLNQEQINRFGDALQKIRQFASQTQASLCNSAGIFNFPECHQDWVRAGIALYGGQSVSHQRAAELKLKPAMIFKAKIMAIHTLSAGECVSYGGLWCADKPHQIGVVSVGYGDGYPRVVEQAKVGIKTQQGQLVTSQVLGRVAMDMLVVDIQGLDVQIGDEVVLWGEHPSVDDIAACADTIGYELMCRITQRPKRQLIDLP